MFVPALSEAKPIPFSAATGTEVVDGPLSTPPFPNATVKNFAVNLLS